MQFLLTRCHNPLLYLLVHLPASSTSHHRLGGPVGPGDQLGHEDVTLIRRTCSEDGTLLKADRPAFAIDRTWVCECISYTVCFMVRYRYH
jgi:hypothetical protein